SLLREVGRVLSDRGTESLVFNCGVLDGTVAESFGDQLDDTEPARGAIAILDEANAFAAAGREGEILGYLKDRGFRGAILIMPHHISRSSESVLSDNMDGWRAASEQQALEAGLQAQDIPHFALPARMLPADLARELMLAQGAPSETVAHALGKL